MPTTTDAWFAQWFDSPYYHLLYRHRDYAEAQFFMQNLIRALPLTPEQAILDLACGKGRHAIYLNAQGLSVTGLDLSPQNIAHARQHENDRLRFAVHDMREQYCEGCFDVILNLFTSFGYFDSASENLQAIRAAAAALRLGGLFLIDFLNPDRVLGRLVPEEVQVHEGVRFGIRRQIEEGYIVKTIAIEDGAEHLNFQERVRAITRDDFVNDFAAAGLAIQELWGDYQLQPFASQHSERLIVLGKKVAIA
ncbi:MAG: SAM-dependent methyltransferase [Bernardetiaceae bacterium]